MKPYTYLLHWSEQDISYYGFRCGNKVPPEADLWKFYFTSSQYVKRFRKEHGEPDIILVDMVFDDKTEAKEYETKYLKSVGVPGNPKWLNRSDGSKNFFHGNTHSEESKKKMSDARKGRKDGPKSTETKQKISKALTGKKRRPNSQWSNEKRSETLRGRKLSADHIEKISQSKKGVSHTCTHKEAISKAKKESPWVATDEQRTKMSDDRKGRKQNSEWVEKRAEKCRGKKYGPQTDDHRAKVSAALKGKPKPPRSPDHIKKQQESRMRTLALKKESLPIKYEEIPGRTDGL